MSGEAKTEDFWQKQMKVLAITAASDRSEMACIKGLKQSGVEIDMLGDLSAQFQAELQACGIAYKQLKLKSRIDPAAIVLLREIFVSGAYDLLHAFTSKALGNALLASSGLKLKKIAYRGTIGHLSRLNPGSWLTFLNPALDRIICVSEAVKCYLLKRGVAAKKLSVVYKGHDPLWYSSMQGEELTSFGIPQGSFVVGCNANMRPVKGVDILLKAAEILCAQGNRDIHYLLVGEVRDKRVMALAKKPSICANVHMPGYRADAAALMRRCSLFVMPSRAREGLPKALLEAMAQGVPVIVTNVGGMTEVVRDGIEGLVAEPSNPASLASAIIKLKGDKALRAKMGQAGAERIKSAFSVEQMVEDTLRVYRAVCE